MMVVAGKLLATTAVHYDPEDSKGEFLYWLNRHDLSRKDGLWLADRRDPVPLERPEWMDEMDSEEWRCMIVKNDFDRILIDSNGRLNLWGNWKWIEGSREESIHVRSALVSPDRSMALLRALQSADNLDVYKIPNAHDDLQIDFDGFQLKGWVVDSGPDNGLDDQDPWAGSIAYPPVPAAYVKKLLNLDSDVEQRHWFIEGDNVSVAWSEVWGHFQEEKNYNTEQESGSRLKVAYPLVVELLRRQEMDMIIEVEIKRNYSNSRWERNKDNDLEYTPQNGRLFLLKSDGSIRTL